MEELINNMGAWGIPAGIVTAIASVLVVLNAIYAIVDKCGKITPAFLNIVKWFKKRKEKKKQQEQALQDAVACIREMRSHTTPEAIARRDAWMQWVNDRAVTYDAAVCDLRSLEESVKKAVKMSEDMYIQNCRTIIIDFSHKVRTPDIWISEDEYNRVFEVYEDYEAFNRAHNRRNGQTTRAMEIIKRAYDRCVEDHNFLEDHVEGLRYLVEEIDE